MQEKVLRTNSGLLGNIVGGQYFKLIAEGFGKEGLEMLDLKNWICVISVLGVLACPVFGAIADFEDLILESIECEGSKDADTECECDGFRVAFVMRRMETMHEFYCDTSTIRLDDEMKKAMEKNTANNVVVTIEEGRNAYE